MKQFVLLLSAGMVAVFSAGCASSSSHVLVGKKRAPIPSESVQVYNSPPPVYEEVALLDASSLNSWSITEQQKMDTAIERLKTEAANLGANGILLRNVGNLQVGPVAPVGAAVGTVISVSKTTTTSSSGAPAAAVYGTGSPPVLAKAAEGIAIYVPEGPPSHTPRERQQLEELQTLKQMLDAGVITRDQYETRKKKVLETEQSQTG